MNPLIVTFVAPPNSERDEVYNKVVDIIHKDAKLKAVADAVKPDQKLQSFESFYQATLNYMSNDIRIRSIARSSEVNLILYRISLLDITSYCMTSRIIGPKYKRMIEKAVFTHLDFFPVNLLFYCEPLRNDQNDPEFMEKEHHKLRVDSSILNIIERADFERVVVDTVQNRADYVMKIIN